MFQIDTGLNVEALAAQFATHGRLQLVGFLKNDGARALHDELANSGSWKLTTNRGEVIHDFDLEQLARWPEDRLAILEKAVTMGGRYGFQFRYDVIRIAAGDSSLLGQFVDFLSSDEVAAFFRQVTGSEDIAFADGHASRYRPGHFLTTHDDHVDTMHRRAAYVMNLTPEWRPDWGGLLQFYDQGANVSRAFTPGFNVLNIFRVPQPHSVSWVTPLAGAPRIAVTGWLRARPGEEG